MSNGESSDIFTWASETDNPGEVVPAFVKWLLESPTVERVQQIQGRVGDEGLGVIARGVAEELLASSATGERDFQNLPQRFEGLPEDFLKALFGSHYHRLQDIAITSKVLFPKPDEPLFDYLVRHAESVKAREDQLGAYVGDGPTAEQADAFLSNLRPLNAIHDVSPSALWNAFQSAVDTEMTWIFPERDAIGKPMIVGLRELQARVGKLLEEAVPEQGAQLHKYVDLALVANAARRQEKLHGNGVSWRLVLARFLYWLGGGRRS